MTTNLGHSADVYNPSRIDNPEGDVGISGQQSPRLEHTSVYLADPLNQVSVSLWKGRKYNPGKDLPETVKLAYIKELKQSAPVLPKGQEQVFTVGQFETYRRQESLIDFTPFRFVDIDKKDQPEYENQPLISEHLFEALANDPHVMYVSYSRSGGLHILVFGEDATYCRNYIEEKTGLIADKSAALLHPNAPIPIYGGVKFKFKSCQFLWGKAHKHYEYEEFTPTAPKGSIESAFEQAEHQAIINGHAWEAGRDNHIAQVIWYLRCSGHSKQDVIWIVCDKFLKLEIPRGKNRFTRRELKQKVVAAFRKKPKRKKRVRQGKAVNWLSDDKSLKENIKKLPHDTVAVVSGPTGLGKTTWIKSFPDAVHFTPVILQTQQMDGFNQIHGESSDSIEAAQISAVWDQAESLSQNGVLKNRLIFCDEVHEMLSAKYRWPAIKKLSDALQQAQRDGCHVVMLTATEDELLHCLDKAGMKYQIFSYLRNSEPKTHFCEVKAKLKEVPSILRIGEKAVIYQDSIRKNNDLKKYLEAAGHSGVYLLDRENGEDFKEYIAQHESLPDEVKILLCTSVLRSGLNLKNTDIDKILTIDIDDANDIIQIRGRIRFSDIAVLDVQTQKRKKRESQLTWADIKKRQEDEEQCSASDKSGLFGPEAAAKEKKEEQLAYRNAMDRLSTHLRYGGIWAAMHYEYLTERENKRYKTAEFVESYGWEIVDSPKNVESVSEDIQQAVKANREQEKKEFLDTIKKDLPAALGKRRIERIKRSKDKYSEQVQELKTDAKGLPGHAASIIDPIIEKGGYLDAFDTSEENREHLLDVIGSLGQTRIILNRRKERERLIRATSKEQYQHLSKVFKGDRWKKTDLMKHVRQSPALESVEHKYSDSRVWKLCKDLWNLKDVGKGIYEIEEFLSLSTYRVCLNGSRKQSHVELRVRETDKTMETLAIAEKWFGETLYSRKELSRFPNSLPAVGPNPSF